MNNRTLCLLALMSCALPAQRSLAEEPRAPAEPIPGKPTTRIALVEAALAALSANDIDAYLELYLDFESTRAHCPGMIIEGAEAIARERFEEGRATVRARLEERFTACHEIVDFDGMEILWREGGGWDDPIHGCRLEVIALDDIEIYILQGDALIEIEIDDPAALYGDVSFFLTDEPRCYVSARSPDRYVEDLGSPGASPVEPTEISPLGGELGGDASEDE